MAGARVLFLGMTGRFSRPPLERLGRRAVAVWVPRDELRALTPPPSKGLPVLTPYAERSIVHLAWELGIPLYEVGDLKASQTLALAAELQPDVLAVACWPRLIPRELRSLVGLAVNVHPSLLPEGRGPAPVFWTLRLGQRRTGVTIHVLEDQADAGPILAQLEVSVPPGAGEAELEQQLAELGGDLLVQVLEQFERGALHPVPQDESRATYHPRY